MCLKKLLKDLNNEENLPKNFGKSKNYFNENNLEKILQLCLTMKFY